MIVYATPTDLAAWVDLDQIDQDDTPQLLAAASRLIRQATITAHYLTNPDGTPADPDIAIAFKEATCAAVTAWLRLDLDPLAGAASEALQPAAVSVLSATVTYSTRSNTATDGALGQAATTLSDQALLILADAGLTSTPPRIIG